jgi:fatty acid CoA ligase FadD9
MPLTHNTGRMFVYTTLANGGRIALHERPDMATLFEELKLVNPTIIVSAPRLYDMVYREYEGELALGRRSKTELKAKYGKVFGNRMGAVCAGGASTDMKVMEFLKETNPCIVIDGYGATECGGIVIEGSVLPNVEWKLIDCPELGYFATDKPYPRGEICVKTKTMMLGYYREEDKTSEVLDKDGFYHTGDVGISEGEGKLRLIDRRKNFFKLSQGEFVAAQKLEALYETISEVDQIMVYGDSSMDAVVAVIVLNATEVNTLTNLYSRNLSSNLA